METRKKAYPTRQNTVAALLATIVLLALVLWATPITAYAASQTQDGLEVSLTTDKGSYAAGDAVTVNVSVKNTNAFAVDNVKLDLVLPAGISLQSGSASITIGTLAAGATETRSFAAKADAASPAPASTAPVGGSPQTGDASNISLWLVLLVLSIGGLAAIVAYAKKRKGAKFLSFFLCFILLAALAGPVLPVHAAVVAKSFSTSENVTVDGAAKQIALKTTYDWNDTTLDVTGVTLNTDTITNFDKDSAQTRQLTAAVAPATAANKAVTWGSSDSSIASVDANGLVTAVGVGTATITVTTEDGGHTDTCAVTVGSKSASNAEAVKITGFTADSSKNDTIVQGFALNAPGLDTGTTLNYVSFKAGADAASAAADTGNTRITNNDFYISTQYIVDAPDITYCGLTFTATLNGVTSDPVTLNISALFGAATTTGKLRTDVAKFAGNYSARGWNGTTGSKPLMSSNNPITLSAGVSIPTTTFSGISGGTGTTDKTQFTISATDGGQVMINSTFGVTGNGFGTVNFSLSCESTSYSFADFGLNVSRV
ncbi:Ig-like domain-containing protein [Clostridia bacterium OttesenSCG-928-O13]|nr:Ig-like domain-containing protein [Clostridia bacterium OttesenSCG-928-O13]